MEGSCGLPVAGCELSRGGLRGQKASCVGTAQEQEAFHGFGDDLAGEVSRSETGGSVPPRKIIL